MSGRADATALPKKLSKVRQACDACHTRKVRCDGCRPCKNCLESVAECTYLAVHKKTGPKEGPRRPRRLPRQQPPAWRPLHSPHPRSSLGGEERSSSRAARTARAAPGSPSAPEDGLGFLPSPRVRSREVQWCIDAYFTHKYPLTPILDREQAGLWTVPASPEQYSLVMACCAVISLSPEILPPSPCDLIIPPADFLINESIRARRFCDLAGNPSLTHIQTSFFLYAVFFCKDKDNAAWYYLREAITILQALRLHEETTYSTMDDPLLAKYGRRMFWVLFITERAYSLQRNRPVTLQDTLGLPHVSPSSSDAEILLGFLDLISLYRHFGADLIATWNSPTRSTNADLDLMSLQNHLRYTLPNVSTYAPAQQADLLMSRQWLKIVVWKLCVSQSTLSITGNSQDAMSLHYPAAIARDVVLASRLVSTEAFEANGIGILEKVFDVGCSLADVLSLVPDSLGSAIDVGPIDLLMEIVKIVGTRFGGSYRHLSMLADKAHGCLLMNVDRSLPLPADTASDTDDRVEELSM